jgi:hypothetical protein
MTITGDTRDAGIIDNDDPADGVGDTVTKVNAAGLDVGSFDVTPPSRQVAVWVFQLPDLSGTNDEVDTANFSVRRFLTQNVTFGVDLWALRVSDPTDGDTGDDQVLTTDYGAGPTPQGPASQGLLQSNFGTSTDATGDAALAQYLRDNYVNDGLLFLRANPDTVNFGDDGAGGTDLHRIAYASANRTDNNLPNLELTFRVIPEPASLSVLGLGGLMLITRRRK